MPFDALTWVDYVIIIAVSAVVGFLVRKWPQIALAAFVGLAADIGVMALLLTLGGASPVSAFVESMQRYTLISGDVLILRAALYGVAIWLVFTLKTLYQRR